ncbi:copper resistance CopC family protein [Agromyces lapidis]|uniref:Copper resistance protein CopC n=1 Tax=Agromyces lapidis TaxID=279574 RepID=A0ABV5SLE2_9MICO|nr:copper resistance CopC family protein [Agromyces lapidis]
MNQRITAATAAAPATRLRAALVAAAAITFAAALALTGGTAAQAHDELLGSSPEPGQVFDTAPTEISLEFSNDIIEVGTAVVVVDHHGEEIEVGDPVIAGATVTASLPTDLSGEYQARWRAVSSDGHPIEGTIDFGVGADATGTWAEGAPHDDAASDEADGDHADGEHADADGDHAEDTAASGPDGWAVAGFVVGGLGVIALIVAVIVNARRKSAGPGVGKGPDAGNGSDAGNGPTA